MQNHKKLNNICSPYKLTWKIFVVSKFLYVMIKQGCQTIFPLEHGLKLLEHQGLKPKASQRREASKGGERSRGHPLPQLGLGVSPRNFFYAPGSNDRGHMVFILSVSLFVCLSVCLSVCCQL